jgi:hypothetical protein
MSFLMLCSIMAFAITDQQVIDYIKQQTAAGKSEQQIGKELMAKGVTPEQAKRIKAQLESQQHGETQATRQTVTSAESERKHNAAEDVSVSSIENMQREIEKGHVRFGPQDLRTSGLQFAVAYFRAKRESRHSSELSSRSRR